MFLSSFFILFFSFSESITRALAGGRTWELQPQAHQNKGVYHSVADRQRGKQALAIRADRDVEGT